MMFRCISGLKSSDIILFHMMVQVKKFVVNNSSVYTWSLFTYRLGVVVLSVKCARKISHYILVQGLPGTLSIWVQNRSTSFD